MAKIYICPNCNSKNIIPLYPQNNIWMCRDCGHRGKPIEIDERYYETYVKSKKQASKLR